MMGCQSSQVRRGHGEDGTATVGSRRLMNESFGLSVHVGRAGNVDLSSRQIDFLGPRILNIIQEDTLRRKAVSLTLTDNLLYTLGKELLLLPDLEELDMDANRFQRLPQVLTKLPNLWRLNASANALDRTTGFQILPQMQALRSLTLRMCSLTSVPDSLRGCPWLENLDLGDNPGMNIETDTLASMTRLRRLNIMNCDLYGNTLPTSVKSVALIMLNISGNHFTFDTDTFFGPQLPSTLQELFLCDMGLSSVPVAVVKLKKLQSLDLAQNPIETLDVLAGRIVKRLAQRRRTTGSAMSSPNSPETMYTSRRTSLNASVSPRAGEVVEEEEEEEGTFPAVSSEAFADAVDERNWVTSSPAHAQLTSNSNTNNNNDKNTNDDAGLLPSGSSSPLTRHARSSSMPSVSDDGGSVASRVSMSKLSKAGMMAHVAQPLQLKKLSLRACGLRTVPKYFHKMACLEELDLSENEQLEDANMTLFSLDKLRVLNITDCPFAVDTSMSHNEWFDISKLRHLTDLQWEVWHGVHNASAYRTKIPLEICGLTLERINEVPLRPDLFVGDTVDTAVNLLRDGYYSVDLSMNENALLSYVESLKIFATTEAFFYLPDDGDAASRPMRSSCSSHSSTSASSTGSRAKQNHGTHRNSISISKTNSTSDTTAAREHKRHSSPTSAGAAAFHSSGNNSAVQSHAAPTSLPVSSSSVPPSSSKKNNNNNNHNNMASSSSSSAAAAGGAVHPAQPTTAERVASPVTPSLASSSALPAVMTTTRAPIQPGAATVLTSSPVAAPARGAHNTTAANPLRKPPPSLPIPTDAQIGAAHLRIAFHRYIFFLAMQAANYDAVIIPPLDVMTIHVSQLTTHPLRYREDCDAICGRILNCNYRSFFLEERRHSAAARDAIAASKKIWNLMVRSAQRELRWLHYDFWEKLLRGVQERVSASASAAAVATSSPVTAEPTAGMSQSRPLTQKRERGACVNSIPAGYTDAVRRSHTHVNASSTSVINSAAPEGPDACAEMDRMVGDDAAACYDGNISSNGGGGVNRENNGTRDGANVTLSSVGEANVESAAATPAVHTTPDAADTVVTSIHLLPNLAAHRSDELMAQYWQELQRIDSSADLAGVLDPSITYHFREHGEETIRGTLRTFYRRHRCFARHEETLRQLKLSWTRYAKFLILYAYRRSVHWQSENTVIMNPMADENGHLFAPNALPRRGQSALVRGSSSSSGSAAHYMATQHTVHMGNAYQVNVSSAHKSHGNSNSTSNNNNVTLGGGDENHVSRNRNRNRQNLPTWQGHAQDGHEEDDHCAMPGGSIHGATDATTCTPRPHEHDSPTGPSAHELGGQHSTSPYPAVTPTRHKSALVLPCWSTSHVTAASRHGTPTSTASMLLAQRHMSGSVGGGGGGAANSSRGSPSHIPPHHLAQRMAAMREFTVDPIPTLGVLLLLHVHRTAHVRYVQTLSLLGVDAVDVQWRESARAMAQTRRAWAALYDDIYMTDAQYAQQQRSRGGCGVDGGSAMMGVDEMSLAEEEEEGWRDGGGGVGEADSPRGGRERRPRRTISTRSTGGAAVSRGSSVHSDGPDRVSSARAAKRSASHLQRRRVKFCFGDVKEGIF